MNIVQNRLLGEQPLCSTSSMMSLWAVRSRTLRAYVVRRKLMAHGHAESKHIKRMGLGCWPLTADADHAAQPICETEG